jgi:hypothetical protein
MTAFSAFQNESDALTFDDLKVENRADRISIYGSLTLTRDQAGLAAAKELRTILENIVAALEGEPDLPVKAAPAEPTVSVKNPFSQA